MARKKKMLDDANKMEREANRLLSGNAADKAKARELLIQVRNLRRDAERMR